MAEQSAVAQTNVVNTPVNKVEARPSGWLEQKAQAASLVAQNTQKAPVVSSEKEVAQPAVQSGKQVKAIDPQKNTAGKKKDFWPNKGFLANFKWLFGFSDKKPDVKKAISVPSSFEASVTSHNASSLQKTKAVVASDLPELPKDEKKVEMSKLSDSERKKFIESEKIFQEGMAGIKDLIAPTSMEVMFDKIKVDGMYAQSFYVFT